MKKLIAGICLLGFVISSHAQTQYFEVVLMRTNGLPLTGATAYLVPVANIYPSNRLLLTAHAQKSGVYYRNAVPAGTYDIWVNQAAYNPPGATVVSGYVKNRDSVAIGASSVSTSHTYYGFAADEVTTTLNEDSTISIAPAYQVEKASVDSLRAREVNVRDYGAIGNGVADDLSAISDAIDAATAGATVVMRDGTYHISADLTIGKPLTVKLDNATLQLTSGSLVLSADSITIRGTNKARSVISQSDDEGAVIVVTAGSDYVTISDVTIRGSATEWVYETPRENGNGIRFQGTEDTAIVSPTVTNCIMTGNIIDILAQYTSNAQFTMNTFAARHTQGIQLNLWQTQQSVVASNTFTGDPGNAVDAIEVIGGGGHTISNNTVSGEYTYEVFNLFSMNNSSVIGNTIRVNGAVQGGTLIVSTSGSVGSSVNTIAGNTIVSPGTGISLSKCTSCGPATAYVTDNIITANTITIRGSGLGIAVGDSCDRNTIAGNNLFVVSPSLDAMYVGKAQNTTITGNTIRSSITDSLRYGLFLNYSDNVSIIGNRFIHVNEAITAGTDTTMDVMLFSNRFDSCTASTFYAGSGTVNLLEGANRLRASEPLGIYGANVSYKRSIPWLSTAEVNAFASVDDGVIVYDKDANALKVRVGGAWKSVTFDP